MSKVKMGIRKYIYATHTGGLFVSSEKYSGETLWCDECQDWDVLIGCAHSKEEAVEVIKTCWYYAREYGFDQYSNYIEQVLREEFG